MQTVQDTPPPPDSLRAKAPARLPSAQPDPEQPPDPPDGPGDPDQPYLPDPEEPDEPDDPGWPEVPPGAPWADSFSAKARPAGLVRLG